MIMKKSLLLSSIVLSSVIAGAQAMDASQEVNGTGTNQIEASQSANTVISKLKVRERIRNTCQIEDDISKLRALYSGENGEKKRQAIRDRINELTQELKATTRLEEQFGEFGNAGKIISDLCVKDEISVEEMHKRMAKLESELVDINKDKDRWNELAERDAERAGIAVVSDPIDRIMNPNIEWKPWYMNEKINIESKISAQKTAGVTKTVTSQASDKVRTTVKQEGKNIGSNAAKAHQKAVACKTDDGKRIASKTIGAKVKAVVSIVRNATKSWVRMAWNKISSMF